MGPWLMRSSPAPSTSLRINSAKKDLGNFSSLAVLSRLPGGARLKPSESKLHGFGRGGSGWSS